MEIKSIKPDFKDRLHKFRVSVSKQEFKKFIPKIYLKLVILGLFLTGVQASFLPELVICSSLFGDKTCDPVGNYLVALSSIPGYIVTGKILSFWGKAPPYVFFAVLFTSAIISYFIVGWVIDNIRFKRFKIGSVEFLVPLVFVLLILALVFLI